MREKIPHLAPLIRTGPGSKIVPPVFFSRSSEVVARDLLGKFLVRRIGKNKVVAVITEVETYDGFKDLGSHASRGKTARNAPMFGPPGCWYVYFTYGMHWMLNIVTREAGYPAAILIRACHREVRPIHPEHNRRESDRGDIPASRLRAKDQGSRTPLNGPAKLAKAFHITGLQNKLPAIPASGLWIEDRGIKIDRRKIKHGPRIGIAYAGKHWASRHLRFWIDFTD